MRVKARDMEEKARIETLDALYTAASALQGRDAVKAFLRDLLTESERIMLGRRVLIARRLLAGESPTDIASGLKVGFDNIYRVKLWLEDQFPGYEKAIAEMEKEFEKRKDRARMTKDGKIDKKLYATSALYRLKKKYPLHFLLFPLPKRKD